MIRAGYKGATVLASLTGVLVVASGASAVSDDPNISENPEGLAKTISTNGAVKLTGAFFKDLGTNGRKCVTCHQPDEGWSVSVAGIRQRFYDTDGKDPIFRLVDGSNSPKAYVNSIDDRYRAYNMLLNHGLVRVERPIPSNAEFTLSSVDDPYHYASANGLSLFRRPLPSTNLRFISTVMWDGREVNPATPMTIANSADTNRNILLASLGSQAQDATTGHAQAAKNLSAAQQQDIVDFELGLSTAQIWDKDAGHLHADGAMGGPKVIENLNFYIGLNDNVNDPMGPFDASAMTLYDAWDGSKNNDRASVARGQALFNTKPIVITGVAGLNDNAYFGSPATLTGSCTTCHNTPDAGNHSLAIALNIGLTDAIRRTPDMPLYTLKNNATGVKIQTTDPGLALSTGKWKDVGRFKGPVLRGLASRAPYFHNGFAADLGAVVDFYHDRFGVTFTNKEKKDLVNFLKTL